MVEESTKRNGETEKEQDGSLSREVEVWKKHDRRGHIASVASVICFCLPGTLILLWFIFCLSIAKNARECGEGMAAVIGVIMGIVYGAGLAVVTSIIGTSLGLYAVLSTEWRRGRAGFVLNLLLLLACCACILFGMACF